MVPMGTFGLLKALGRLTGDYSDYHRRVRAEYLSLEVATVFVGLVQAHFFPFSPLIFIVAGSIFYASMDVVPVITERPSEQVRRWAFIVIGIEMVLLSFVLKDMGFWLLQFGVLSVWMGWAFLFPKAPSAQCVVFILNLLMSCASTSFFPNLLAFIGLLSFLGRLGFEISEDNQWFTALRALVGIVMMGFGTSEHGTVLHTFVGVLILLHCNLSSGKWLLKTNELWLIVQLLFNLSLMISAPLFSQSLPLFLFDVPLDFLVRLVAFVGMVQSIVSSSLLEYLDQASSRRSVLRAVEQTTDLLIRRSFTSYTKPVLRLVRASALLWCACYFEAYWLVYVAFVDLNLLAITYLLDETGKPKHRSRIIGWVFTVLLCLIHVLFVGVFGSFYLHLVLTIELFVFIVENIIRLFNDHPSDLFFSCVAIFPVAIFAGSRLLIGVMGIGVFAWLAWLAWEKFKNSLLFPFVLTLYGLGLMGLGILYQSYEDEVLAYSAELIPFELPLEISTLATVTMATPSMRFSPVVLFLEYAHTLGWSWHLGLLVSFLVPCLLVWVWYRFLHVPLNLDFPPSMRVTRCKMDLDPPGAHGVMIEFEGVKPEDLVVEQLWLHFSGDSFWSPVQARLGGFAASLFRTSLHPVALSPNYTDLSGGLRERGNTEVRARLSIGTQEFGGYHVSHATINRTLTTLSTPKEKPFKIHVLYKDQQGNRGVLFDPIEVRFCDLLRGRHVDLMKPK